MDDKLFIKTSDTETSILLKKSGYRLIDLTSGIYTFENKSDGKIVFTDLSKVTFSNKLCF